MKKYLIVALLLLFSAAVHAQTVTPVPIFINNSSTVKDLGNGPLEVRVVQGSAQIWTAQGSGIGSGTTTTITLTATPAIPPCIGCSISGGTLTSSSHVVAYNGTTGITTDTSQTIGAATPLAWGAACPATPGAPALPVQAAVGSDLPLYTSSRICASGQYAAGAAILTFPIGAH